jgi:hypothetical protein
VATLDATVLQVPGGGGTPTGLAGGAAEPGGSGAGEWQSVPASPQQTRLTSHTRADTAAQLIMSTTLALCRQTHSNQTGTDHLGPCTHLAGGVGGRTDQGEELRELVALQQQLFGETEPPGHLQDVLGAQVSTPQAAPWPACSMHCTNIHLHAVHAFC